MRSGAERRSDRAWIAFALVAACAATQALAAPWDVLDVVRNGVAGIDGLAGVRALAASPDGAYLYAASTSDDAVAIFAVGANGALALVDAVHDGELDVDGVGVVDGLAQAMDVATSDDGAHVYVAGAADDALAVFARQPNGLLRFVQEVTDAALPVSALDGASGVVAVGDRVYAIGIESDAVAAFTRNPATGALAFLEAERDDATRSLEGPVDLAASPDGANLYVVNLGAAADSLVAFRIVAGGLTLVDTELDGVGGVAGLDLPTAVAVSPDGAHVYATGALSDSVAIFDRSPLDGSISFAGWVQSGSGGFEGFSAPLGCAVTPDGDALLVASVADGALAVLSRDAQDGSLGFDRALVDGVESDALAGAADVAVDPFGRFVYVAASGEDAITVFAPEPPRGWVAAASAGLMGLAARLRRATQSPTLAARLRLATRDRDAVAS